MEYAMIDGTIVSVHQKATGAKSLIRKSAGRPDGSFYVPDSSQSCHDVTTSRRQLLLSGPKNPSPARRRRLSDRALKGDSKSGHRPLERRTNDQNHGVGRCTRQFGALCSDARPTQRHHGVRAFSSQVETKFTEGNHLTIRQNAKNQESRAFLRSSRIGKRSRPLIDGVSFDALLADKAFDADWLRLELDARGVLSVIPPRKNRKQLIQTDTEMYKWRHLVENYFAKIKEFRGIATRYDKTDESFRANINLTATIIACR